MMAAWALIAIWTWGSAGMLLWGLAAAIPLVLHWWSRRRFDEMPWAAMDFLLAAMRKNARRLRIEQLLLLLVRTALLAVFAVAVADPVLNWQSEQIASSIQSPTHYLFVLDNSYSMSYRSREQSRLDAAKQAIHALVDSCRAGDGFSLMLMQDPSEARVAVATTDRQELDSQLAAVKISHGGANLLACLTAVDRQLDVNRRRNPQFEKTQVVFLTDLGRTTWESVVRHDSQTLLTKLSEKSVLSLIDVGEERSPNVAISRLGSSQRFVTAGETARLEAEIRSTGSLEPERRRVDFLVNDRIIDSQNVVVPSNGSVIAATNHRFEMVGDMPIEVRSSLDSLAIDDRRWMVMSVRKSLEVLCIQGEAEAADFLALALNPSESVDAPLQATIASESALLEQSLQRFDCVLLSNVAQVGFNEQKILDRYVRDGGGLVIALGDRVQAETYNRELGDGASSQRLLPARLEGLSPIEEHFFDPLEYKHEIVAPFRGHERAGLLTVPTWRHFVLRPLAPTAEIALSFDNRNPAIVAESIGRGRVIMVATALSPTSTEPTVDGQIPWTALPTWPSFPPLIDGLVHSAARGRVAPRNLIVGTAIPIEVVDATASRANLTVPDGSVREFSLSSHDRGMRGVFSDTAAVGIYTAKLPQSQESSTPIIQRFAINLDTRESDLSQLPSSQLPSGLFAQDELEAGASLVVSPGGVAWFRYLLAAVVVLLAIESSLASWFARRAV